MQMNSKHVLSILQQQNAKTSAEFFICAVRVKLSLTAVFGNYMRTCLDLILSLVYFSTVVGVPGTGVGSR